MEKQKGVYGVYFMKGAFFIELKWKGDDLATKPIHSKNCEQVYVIGGTFMDLEELLNSNKGSEAKVIIENVHFDFIVMGHGESVSYFLNTNDGVIKCNLDTYIKE